MQNTALGSRCACGMLHAKLPCQSITEHATLAFGFAALSATAKARFCITFKLSRPIFSSCHHLKVINSNGKLYLSANSSQLLPWTLGVSQRLAFLGTTPHTPPPLRPSPGTYPMSAPHKVSTPQTSAEMALIDSFITDSIIHLSNQSIIHSLTQSFTHPSIHSLAWSFICFFVCSFTHSFIHSFGFAAFLDAT